MSKGIIIFGAPGSGQTTIGKDLAKALNFPHFDLDDYHWRWDTKIPYTVYRSGEERIANLTADISKHPNFVMSGSMWSIRKSFNDMFDLAVYVAVPDEIRAERIRKRELKRWGDRILPGGDMYEANDVYSKSTLQRVLEYKQGNPSMYEQHKQWMAELTCPVICIDGTLPVSESAKLIRSEAILKAAIKQFT